MTEFEIKPYKAEHGVEMLKRVEVDFPDAEKWCRDAEEQGRAFSVFNGELVCCAGISHKMEGIGVAWALYPLDIGKFHIDPQLARDKIGELMKKFNYRRVEATVREDFAAGHSYMRYLGFKVEGLMICYEPDGTNAFLYARTDKCKRCGKCCYLAYYDGDKIIRTSKKCPHLTEKNLCSIYDCRPDWCMTANQMAKLGLLPEGCGYQGDK